MNRKLVSTMIVLVLTFSACPNVRADVASDKAKIKQVQAQMSTLENKMEMMDNQIESIMIKIDDNNKDITGTQNQIKQAEMDIANAEAEIEAEQLLYGQRMRVMYMNGSPTDYVGIVLDSSDFSDFISRLDNIKRILSFNQNIIDEFKAKKEAIDKKKAALDVENKKLLALKTDNQNRLSDLNKQKSEQNAVLSQLKAQERQYGVQLAASQAAELTASRAAISKARSSTPVMVDSRGKASYSSNAVLAYASNYLGVPYVWGGTTPAGFDCSGFVRYVYAHFGIYLPRVSQDQQNVGMYVSRDQLQPGDLVFFGDPAHHVGIYVGNGNMIDAPHTGDVVKIERLHSDFTNGRRVK